MVKGGGGPGGAGGEAGEPVVRAGCAGRRGGRGAARRVWGAWAVRRAGSPSPAPLRPSPLRGGREPDELCAPGADPEGIAGATRAASPPPRRSGAALRGGAGRDKEAPAARRSARLLPRPLPPGAGPGDLERPAGSSRSEPGSRAFVLGSRARRRRQRDTAFASARTRPGVSGGSWRLRKRVFRSLLCSFGAQRREVPQTEELGVVRGPRASREPLDPHLCSEPGKGPAAAVGDTSKAADLLPSALRNPLHLGGAQPCRGSPRLWVGGEGPEDGRSVHRRSHLREQR